MSHDPCTSADGNAKKRWATEQAARFLAHYIHVNGGPTNEVYECPACKGWHLTTRGFHHNQAKGRARKPRQV